MTSSRFQRPQVNCRVVDTNSKILMISRAPIGAKKYVKISLSPAIKRQQQPRSMRNQCKQRSLTMGNYKWSTCRSIDRSMLNRMAIDRLKGRKGGITTPNENIYIIDRIRKWLLFCVAHDLSNGEAEPEYIAQGGGRRLLVQRTT